MNKTDKMRTIKEEVLNLRKSPLYAYRVANNYFPVIGEGSHDAHIMFIGEAPGKNEAETARPFCGASGRVLDKLLASVGISRADVYVTNIVKDRPPDNRDPTPDEILLYTPFLDRQIDIIQPKVIATLGRFSMVHILQRFGIIPDSISKTHGSVYTAQASYGEIKIIPLYHPATALYNGSMLSTLEEDFKQLAIHGISKTA